MLNYLEGILPLKFRLNNFYSETYSNKDNKFRFIFVVLGNLGKSDEAIIMYNQALKINPNDAETYFNKGKSFWFILGVGILGKFDEAIILYDISFKINLNDA